MKLNIKLLHADVPVPRYATSGASAFDLRAYFPHYPIRTVVPGTEGVIIPTGIAVEVPPGYGLMILSRSGHGFNERVTLANGTGLIDSDYRGEIMVKLVSDLYPLEIRQYDRIAQAVLVPMPQVEFVVVDELSKTERGAGGFGSTGAQ